MNILLVFVTCILVCIALSQNDETIQSYVANGNFAAALNSPRYVKRQLKCALNEAPCDDLGRRLKHIAPHALHGTCPNCTTEEVKLLKVVLGHIQKNHPKEWGKLIRSYAG